MFKGKRAGFLFNPASLKWKAGDTEDNERLSHERFMNKIHEREAYFMSEDFLKTKILWDGIFKSKAFTVEVAFKAFSNVLQKRGDTL